MIVKDNAKDFEKMPTGLQSAVCHSNVDLGMQPGFQGAVTHKVALVFEMAAVRKEGDFAGRRWVVTQTYSASLNEKANLAKALEGWRGRAFTPEERSGFDLDRLRGVPCTLNMVEVTKQDGTTSVVIGNILPPLKDAPEMKPENPPEFIPKWLAKMIANQAQQPVDNSDIPF